jgi:hypothetical protein
MKPQQSGVKPLLRWTESLSALVYGLALLGASLEGPKMIEGLLTSRLRRAV